MADKITFRVVKAGRFLIASAFGYDIVAQSAEGNFRDIEKRINLLLRLENEVEGGIERLRIQKDLQFTSPYELAAKYPQYLDIEFDYPVTPAGLQTLYENPITMGDNV